MDYLVVFRAENCLFSQHVTVASQYPTVNDIQKFQIEAQKDLALDTPPIIINCIPLSKVQESQKDRCVWIFDNQGEISIPHHRKWKNIKIDGIQFCPYCGKKVIFKKRI